MNLAQTRSTLGTKLTVASKSNMEHNEMLMLDKIGDITLQNIL